MPSGTEHATAIVQTSGNELLRFDGHVVQHTGERCDLMPRRNHG